MRWSDSASYLVFRRVGVARGVVGVEGTAGTEDKLGVLGAGPPATGAAEPAAGNAGDERAGEAMMALKVVDWEALGRWVWA